MKPEENNGFDKEEGRQNPVLMLAVGAVLVAVIVLLCVLIWKVSHAGNGPEKNDWHTSGNGSESVSATMADTQETPAEAGGAGENETTDSIGNGTEENPSGSLPTEDSSEGPSQNGQSGDTVTTADGRVITFTPCDDTIMPKIEVNLRSEPSTSKGNETVYCLVKYGESLHRTGYDAAMGWSRVEYDGQVLYVVTSYTFIVEDTSQEE